MRATRDIEELLDELDLHILQAHPDTGLPIRRLLEVSGLARTTAKRVLDQLRAEGLVDLSGGGRAARWKVRQ